jgi:hypothetical protein
MARVRVARRSADDPHPAVEGSVAAERCNIGHRDEIADRDWAGR